MGKRGLLTIKRDKLRMAFKILLNIFNIHNVMTYLVMITYHYSFQNFRTGNITVSSHKLKDNKMDDYQLAEWY